MFEYFHGFSDDTGILKDKKRLSMFENQVLRRWKVTEGLRKLHNEELCNLYSS
jgi:hypothetical protein